MTVPYATFREDVTDAADNIADFSWVAADLECYLNAARRSAYCVLGASMPEIDELKADVDALVAKADKLESLVRSLGRRGERGSD